VTEAWRLADLHGYVDGCLEPGERSVFEAQMAADPALARRAAVWREQNNAIRSAFDCEGARAFPISLGRQANENNGKRRRPAPISERPPRDPAAGPFAVGGSGAVEFPSRAGSTRGFWPSFARSLALAALSACLVCLWPPAEPIGSGARFGEAGVAAFRAFGRPTGESPEFETRDLAELEKQIDLRLSRPVYLPRSPSAIRMVDARIAPAPGAAGAFLVYEAERSRIGLLIQPLDAPSTRAPDVRLADGRYVVTWTRAGQGYALVGDVEAASLLKLATDFFDAPAEAAQFMPERGS
jgi:anti-sigma factor RsiW